MSGGGFVDEHDAANLLGRFGMREDEVSCLRAGKGAGAAHFQAVIQGLAAHNCCVDRGEERGHRVVLGHEEEVDGAVRTGNVTIQADADAEDDISH